MTESPVGGTFLSIVPGFCRYVLNMLRLMLSKSDNVSRRTQVLAGNRIDSGAFIPVSVEVVPRDDLFLRSFNTDKFVGSSPTIHAVIALHGRVVFVWQRRAALR